MAEYSPETNLLLLSVPIQSDYTNTFYFADKDAQTSFFKGKAVKTYENFQYIKKEHRIRVPAKIDDLYICNYVMYQNSNFTEKWFYAFITGMEWASENSTNIYIVTDCIQTWYFDITYYNSFTIRAHSSTDEVGDNIIPEDFTLGNGGYQVSLNQDLPPDYINVYASCNYNGSVSGTGTVRNGMWVPGATGIGTRLSNSYQMGQQLNQYVENGLAYAISRVQQTPSALQGSTVTYTFPRYPDNINGYTPKNKKLLSSAFVQCFIQLYGNEATFNPAFITDSNVSVKVTADLIGGAVGAFIGNYSNEDIGTINISTVIPTGEWTYNQYKNDYNLHGGSNAMLTERLSNQRTANKITSTIDTANSGIKTLTGVGSSIMQNAKEVATGNRSLVGAVGNVISSSLGNISDTISEGYNASYNWRGIDEISQELAYMNESYNAPAKAATPSSNIYITSETTALTGGYKVPPSELAERADDYLTVYGYKQNTYMTPNLHARKCWTYIQTAALNASGNFPQDDLNVIKRAFNNGIFFWDSSKTFGDFSQDNGIAS